MAAPGALRVLYADAALLVVDKPAGLLSVPGRTALGRVANAATLLTAVCLEPRGRALLAAARALPSASDVVRRLLAAEGDTHPAADAADAAGARTQHLRRGTLPWTTARQDPALPLAVHRLDEATSGLLAFALSYPMQRALQQQLQPGAAATKVYEAVVDSRAVEAAAAAALARRGGGGGGALSALATHDEGVIDTPLQRHSHLPLLSTAAAAGAPHAEPHAPAAAFDAAARACTTRWRVLERGDGAVRLRLQPLTGRTHQLRLHCALPPPFGLGAPIVGDSFYGDPELAAFPYVLELAARARELELSSAAAAAAASQPQQQQEAQRRQQFVSSAQLLVAEHAARAALLARDGRRAPRLASCALLSAAPPGAPAGRLPRLLLHATELHLDDAFSLADRALNRVAHAAAVATAAAARLQRHPSAATAARRAAATAAAAAAAAAALPPENLALVTALEAGAGLWQRVAPWHVEWGGGAEAGGGGRAVTVAAAEAGGSRPGRLVFSSPAPF